MKSKFTPQKATLLQPIKGRITEAHLHLTKIRCSSRDTARVKEAGYMSALLYTNYINHVRNLSNSPE